MKSLFVLPIFMMLTGCAFDPSLFKSDPEIKIVTVNKPVLYCPAPPTFTYPRLLILDLVEGDEKDPGRVVQYYKAAVKQLEGEIQSRDRVIKAYEDIQTQDPNLLPIQVEQAFKEKVLK